MTKQSNAKGGKKPQQQQQANSSANGSPFVIIQPRKNSKNQKNPNGKGSKQRTTTPHPFTTLYSIKDRKYDIINGIVSVNRPTTTVRPANKPLINNVDSKLMEKTIGHEKTAVKAPKQIKEKLTTTTSKATTIGLLGGQIEMVDKLQQQQQQHQQATNPDIPKLFQKYEKIQQIYPEFHPYVVQQPKQAPSNGGKPSRDGSRNQFFTNTAAAGAGGGKGASIKATPLPALGMMPAGSSVYGPAVKKSSIDGAQKTRTQTSAFVSSSTKIAKG